MPGRGPGTARCPVGAALDPADAIRGWGTCSLPAASARLPQADQGRGAADLQDRYQRVAGNMQIEEVRLPDATDRLVICYNPDAADRDAAIRAGLVGELDELIVGTDTLTVTKRAELRGRISTMSGLNGFLRVTPGGLLPDRQDQGLGGREPGLHVPAALRRPAAVRRGHRGRLQAAPRSRARLGGT
jgi:hypothetical protein